MKLNLKLNNNLVIGAVILSVLIILVVYTRTSIKELFQGESCNANNEILDSITAEDLDAGVDERAKGGDKKKKKKKKKKWRKKLEQEETHEDDVDYADADADNHNRLVKKTDVYPMLRKISNKIGSKCPEVPDMDKYVLKSKVPDMSNYVLKTNIVPDKNCPDCVCPKVNVTAGLCKKQAPCAPCPAPQRCPKLSCPEHKKCPEMRCPEPKPYRVRRRRRRGGCKVKNCSGCSKCMPKSDGLLNNPSYPGSEHFAHSRATNGIGDDEPTLSVLNELKGLF